MSALKIEQLYISPGHNFFGHHGKLPDAYPMNAVDQIECVAGQGIRGDRFFGHKENYKGQITFFEVEMYEKLCHELKVNDKATDSFRRNVITRGIDLNTLIGKKFEIQGVQFEGSAECSPCYWMNSAFAPGAEELLQGHGGLRARILTDGILKADV
ncbi:MAG: MOSC domain-containing protein [Chthoniobacterales bacterium]